MVMSSDKSPQSFNGFLIKDNPHEKKLSHLVHGFVASKRMNDLIVEHVIYTLHNTTLVGSRKTIIRNAAKLNLESNEGAEFFACYAKDCITNLVNVLDLTFNIKPNEIEHITKLNYYKEDNSLKPINCAPKNIELLV